VNEQLEEKILTFIEEEPNFTILMSSWGMEALRKSSLRGKAIASIIKNIMLEEPGLIHDEAVDAFYEVLREIYLKLLPSQITKNEIKQIIEDEKGAYKFLAEVV